MASLHFLLCLMYTLAIFPALECILQAKHQLFHAKVGRKSLRPTIEQHTGVETYPLCSFLCLRLEECTHADYSFSNKVCRLQSGNPEVDAANERYNSINSDYILFQINRRLHPGVNGK